MTGSQVPHGGRSCYKGLLPPYGEDPQEMQRVQLLFD